MASDRKKCIISLLVTAGIVILVAVYIVIAYVQKWYPFQPYKRSPLPKGMFYPTGEIKPIDQEKIDYGMKLLACLDKVGIAEFNSKCLTAPQA